MSSTELTIEKHRIKPLAYSRAAVVFTALVLASTLRARPTTTPATRPSAERIAPPDAELARIRDAAILAETANAAGLDWKPYYVAYMRLKRREDWTDPQIKFIGVYFGATQGFYEKELREKKFTQDEVLSLQARLEKETARLDHAATTRPYRQRGE